MRPRHRLRRAFVLALAGLLAAALPALAIGPSAVQVTGTSPYYDTACTADAIGSQFGTNFPNTEVEPHLAVNPTNPDNLVGSAHQDRWSNGGSRGDVLVRSFDGGATWTTFRIPGIAACDGGQWPRGTDPWLSFAPNGRLYFVSQSFDDANSLTAFMLSSSTDGGLTWSTAVPVSYRSYGYPHYTFDDKVALTADPNDATGRTAYLVWDRFSDSPSWYREHGWNNPSFPFNGGFSSVWMSRTTDGGATWTKPNEIYRPGTNSYTGGPIIAVQPNGTVVLGVATWFQNKGGTAWTTYAMYKQSTNGGKTWAPRIAARGCRTPGSTTPRRPSGCGRAADSSSSSPTPSPATSGRRGRTAARPTSTRTRSSRAPRTAGATGPRPSRSMAPRRARSRR